jgi:hypothetical protein
VAGYPAIAATSRAILSLLEAAAIAEDEFRTAAFSAFTSSELRQPPNDRVGVSLYLYHVAINTSRRNATGRIDLSGTRYHPALPLDLHYLLTAWAKDATTQQRLLGWAVRVIHDAATIPAGLLNAYTPNASFRPDETIELIWQSLSQQDVFDIWEVARANQQPSAAYVARVIEIESTIPVDEYPLVQSTDFRYGTAPA